jgi:hypothetical protein
MAHSALINPIIGKAARIDSKSGIKKYKFVSIGLSTSKNASFLNYF